MAGSRHRLVPGQSTSSADIEDEENQASLLDAGAPAKMSPDKAPPIRVFLALMLLVTLSYSLYLLPVNRVIEMRLCLEHYETYDPTKIVDGSVDESLCKIDDVQRGLAWIQGVMETAWIVGDFVMTIPLTFVAEQYGRQTVLYLNLVPRVALPLWAIVVGYCDKLLPTRAIVAAPFLSVLGGDCVFGSLMYSLAASMTDDHVKRASYFGYMSSVTYVVALTGPALAAASMSWVLWLPFWIGIALLVAAVPAIARLPPGKKALSQERREDDGDGRDGQASPLLGHTCSSSASAKPGSILSANAAAMLSSLRAHLQELVAIVTSHPRNLSLLLVSFLLTAIASADTKLLTQYISKRYSWTFAAAGYLLSGKAVVNFVLLAFVVPSMLARRSRARGSGATAHAHRDNLRLARLCLGVSAIGATIIALSVSVGILVPGLFVYALGSVLPVFTWSLLKSPDLLPPAEDSPPDSQIYAIVMLVKTLGSLLGAPTMATLWVWGMTLGGAALGLPYFVSAVCYLAAVGVFAGIVIE